MEPDTMIFNLSKEREYSSKGDFKKTFTLEFRPPGPQEFRPANKLAQLVMNAAMDVGKNAPKDQQSEEDQKNPTGDEMKIILMSSSKIDFNDIFDAFKTVALATGTFDGEEPLAEVVFSKLSIEDCRRVACEYIAFFVFPSLFSEGDSQNANGGS